MPEPHPTPARPSPARVAYALAGHGRGHLSRALAVAAALRGRGVELAFVCGGPAAAALEARGETVLRVPALRYVIREGRGRVGATVRANLRRVLLAPWLPDLVGRLEEGAFDLLVSDFEPFAPVAAELARVPVAALSHQQVLTEARLPPAVRLRPAVAATAAAVRLLTPARPVRALVSALAPLPLRRPGAVRLLPPLLRPAVLEAVPTRGRHVLAYVNAPRAAPALLEALGAHAPVRLYGPRDAAGAPPGVELRPASEAGFVADLASCRAVVCSAGFNLLAEARHLGKPVLAIPNAGQAEQLVNALHLEAAGGGRRARLGRPLGPQVDAFLSGPPPAPAARWAAGGADLTADALEVVLRDLDGPPAGAGAAPAAGAGRTSTTPSGAPRSRSRPRDA